MNWEILQIYIDVLSTHIGCSEKHQTFVSIRFIHTIHVCPNNEGNYLSSRGLWTLDRSISDLVTYSVVTETPSRNYNNNNSRDPVTFERFDPTNDSIDL